MAKSRKVFIEVIVDDKGTTQKLAVDANKLEKALAGSNKETKNTDRALRGAANMSSNTTKNFSKMQQGISGGIVPAYAELAARVFAVTAAFRFLQEAADTRNLIQGQQQFGALMGTNYAGITKALQDATNGQLRFTEAAQATAIGTAAGLTQKQLTGLATAAKNASFALGRDLTDSFNRLIRGVTKAEPELLDELGIILRLDPALNQYAGNIGKTAKELTAFERSQAVANFVLDEAETKFAKIERVMNEDAFAVAQFGKAFDDVLNSIKQGLVTGLTPVLQFLSKNIGSLISLFGLLALPLLRSVIPNLEKFGESAQDAVKKANNFAENAANKFRDLSKQTRILGKDMDEVRTSAKDLSTGAGIGEGQKTGTGFAFFSGEDESRRAQNNAKKILEGAERQFEESGKITTGKLQNFNEQQLKDLRESYNQRTLVVKTFEKKTRLSFQGIRLEGTRLYRRLEAGAARTFGFMAKQATRAAKVIDFAFKAAGFLGIALLLIDLGKAAVEFLRPTSKEAKRAQEEFEALASKTEELNRHITKVAEIRADLGLLNFAEAAVQAGNALKEVDLGNFINQINTLQQNAGMEGFEAYKANILNTAEGLKSLGDEYSPLSQAIIQNRKVTDKEAQAMAGKAEKAIRASNALQQLQNAQKAVTTETNNLVNSIAKVPFQSLISALTQDYSLQLEADINLDKADFDKKIAEYDKKITESQKLVFRPLGQGPPLPGQAIVDKPGDDSFFPQKGYLIRSRASKKLEEETQAAKEKEIALENKRKDLLAEAGRKLENALDTQNKALGIEENINTRKREAAEIDKVSQDLASQINRLKISELNQENKIDQAKQKELAAELAILNLLEEKVKPEDQRMQNASRALMLAQEATAIEEKNLENVRALNALKEFQLTLDERRLRIQEQIQKSEALIARTRIAQKRAVTPGAGTVGRSRGEIGRDDRDISIAIKEEQIANNILSIEDARVAIARAQASGKLSEILSAEQLLRQAEIRGIQLQRELEIIDNIVLQETERNRLALEDGQNRLNAFSISSAVEAANLRIIELQNKGVEVSESERKKIIEQNIALEEQKLLLEGMQGLRATIEQSFERAFMSIVDGSMSAKEAFAQMAKSILAQIAKMIIQMMIFRAISSFATMGAGAGAGAGAAGAGATAAPLPPPMFARRGGMFESYATGGIARGRQSGYPAMLHGTEAVVPLGTGKKAIPVEFTGKRGMGGDVNNINITVSTDGSTRQEEGDGNKQSRELGRVISMAVQEELHKQKRPGGILSPLGAA